MKKQSQILACLEKSKTRKKSDADFYDNLFVNKSESNVKQSQSTISNFHCWLEIDNTSTEELFKYLKGIENEESREQTILNMVNMFMKYMITDGRKCPYCRGTGIKKDIQKFRQPYCHVCMGDGTLRAVKATTLKGYLSHLRKYLGYFGFNEVFSTTFYQQIELPDIILEQAMPITDEMFKELYEETHDPKRRFYLKVEKLSGLRPKETFQLTEKNFEAISVDGEIMEIPQKWIDLKDDSKFRKLRIVLTGDMTKTGNARHSWISDQILDQMLVKLDQEDGLLFTKNTNPTKAVTQASAWFREIRERLGKKNPKWLERFEDEKGEHKYKIYSLRAKFISDCRIADPSGNAGHYWAGHQKYMQVYERYSIKESLDLFNNAEEGLRTDKTSIPEGIESEASQLRKENMQLQEEKELREIQHENEIQRIHDEATKQRIEDLAKIEIKLAELQISKSKKKSK
jgi:hypothetical protein